MSNYRRRLMLQTAGGGGTIDPGEPTPIAGVGIKSLDTGTYYTIARYNALRTKPANAVVYYAGTETAFIIHPNTNSKAWSNTSVLVSGVRSVSSYTTLLYRGEADTDAMIAAVSNGTIADAPAAQWVRELSFADGTIPYVPCNGDIQAIIDNITEINECRTALGQGTISARDAMWTSLQTTNAATAVYWSGSSFYRSEKKTARRIIPIGNI